MILDKEVSAGEYPALVALWERAVRATHHFLPEERIAFYRERIPALYFPMVSLVAARSDEGSLLGFMGLVPPGESGENASLAMLFVDPAVHGQGVGSALLALAEERFSPLDLDVNEQNEKAAAFYLKRGFVPYGRSERDGEGDPFPLVHMRKEPSPWRQGKHIPGSGVDGGQGR